MQGCDIPDIEDIVQYQVPDNLSIWTQRAGRAGRSPNINARAVLLVQPSVFAEKGKLTRKEGDPIEYVKKIDGTFRKYIDIPEGQCRRDAADKYFDNPPERKGVHCVLLSL